MTEQPTTGSAADDEFTDDEMRDLLTRILTGIHGSPLTPAAAQRIEDAVRRRRAHRLQG